jgi:hypothetical protein
MKRQVQFPHSMPLPNRSFKIRTHGHVSAVRSLTACHAAHYHAVSTSSLKRRTPMGGEEELQMDPSRQRSHRLRAHFKSRGFESWPSTRVRQLPSSNPKLGMTESRPIQGQGSSCSLETPSDIFEAKGGVGDGIPSKGGIEPSDPIERSRDPRDNSLALLESASAADSQPLSNGARAPTRIYR